MSELESIKREIRSIIGELNQIAAGIDRDFKGIGNEKCAAKIYKVADHYSNVVRKLNSIDTSKVTDEFAKRQGGTSC